MMHSQNTIDALRSLATVTMEPVNQHGRPLDVTVSPVTMVTHAVSVILRGYLNVFTSQFRVRLSIDLG